MHKLIFAFLMIFTVAAQAEVFTGSLIKRRDAILFSGINENARPIELPISAFNSQQVIIMNNCMNYPNSHSILVKTAVREGSRPTHIPGKFRFESRLFVADVACKLKI